MKYFIRSIKYLVYFGVIFFLIVGLLCLFSRNQETANSFSDMFEEGSIPKIIAFFAAVAAFYPALGFHKRELHLNGPYSQYSETVKEVFGSFDYDIETESPEAVSFRLKSTLPRISRMCEDRITLFISENSVYAEGLRKDVDRIVRTIEYKIREAEEPQEE